MTRLQVVETGFTSGELAPELMGRIDLKAYEEGAARLRNVRVLTTGGVARRSGTARIAEAGSAARIIPFDSSDGELLILLGEDDIVIRNKSSVVQSDIGNLWTNAQLRQITWTRLDEGLLICHPDLPPYHLRRDPLGHWGLFRWDFETIETDIGEVSTQPYSKLVNDEVILQALSASIALPEEEPVPAGATVRITVSSSIEPFFSDNHKGSIIRLKGREIRISNVTGGFEAFGLALQELVDGKPTRFFDEQVFSEARGWPAAATLHQDRLVLGGSPAAADQLWLSRTGSHRDFRLIEGLDDEPISLRLGDRRLHRIRHLVGGRRLQVMTDLGEWVVTGRPLTPTSISVDLQTNVGSPTDRQVRPLQIDGATLFVGASKRDVREFLFADTEQAYQAPDIALLSRHLIRDPVDMDFDLDMRSVALALGDGNLATATIDRNANIVAWSLQDLGGAVKSVCQFDDNLHLLVQRGDTLYLEALDPARRLDSSTLLTSPTPQTSWSGLDGHVGETVSLVGDGVMLGSVSLGSGTIVLGQPVRRLEVGLLFMHIVEPVPVSRAGRNSPLDTLYRPIRSVFRVTDCGALRLDTGRGQRTVLQPAGSAPRYQGDLAIRSFGWRRGLGQWPWRIEQIDPEPFTLLSVSTEIKVNQ